MGHRRDFTLGHHKRTTASYLSSEGVQALHPEVRDLWMEDAGHGHGRKLLGASRL